MFSASAICGTRRGLTKLATSMRRTPASRARRMNSTFTAVGTLAASFCRPSRGPTSTISMLRLRAITGIVYAKGRGDFSPRPPVSCRGPGSADEAGPEIGDAARLDVRGRGGGERLLRVGRLLAVRQRDAEHHVDVVGALEVALGHRALRRFRRLRVVLQRVERRRELRLRLAGLRGERFLLLLDDGHLQAIDLRLRVLQQAVVAVVLLDRARGHALLEHRERLAWAREVERGLGVLRVVLARQQALLRAEPVD